MSGCSLRCVRISTLPINERASTSRPSRSLSGNSLQDVGHVYNIKIVTLEHVVPPVALSILRASDLGLWLSIVYDTSSFDSLGSLRLMDGLVDIYLADFKVWDPSASRRLLKADDYDATARESVCAMQAQGATEVSTDCFVNIMEQYHWDGHIGREKRDQRPCSAPGEGVRYAHINSAATGEEISSIRKAASDARL